MKLQSKTYTWLSWIMCVVVIVVYTLVFSTKISNLEKQLIEQENRHAYQLEMLAQQFEKSAKQYEGLVQIINRQNEFATQIEQSLAFLSKYLAQVSD